MRSGIKDWLAGQRHCCLRLATSFQLCTSNATYYPKQRYCASTHNTKTIHNCMQLKTKDFLTNIRSLPNEIKKCRSNVSCGSGDLVSGATGEAFFIGRARF